MDLLLPDEGTFDIMRQEFENLDIGARARAMTGAIAACMTNTYDDNSDEKAQNSLRLHKNDFSDAESAPSQEEEQDEKTAPSSFEDEGERGGQYSFARQKAGAYALLYLYFIKVLRYNSRYGTQIYDAQRGLGGLQPDACAFRDINDLV